MTTIDPIALEVLWSRLLSVTNEQQAALMRTAFSTVCKKCRNHFHVQEILEHKPARKIVAPPSPASP